MFTSTRLSGLEIPPRLVTRNPSPIVDGSCETRRHDPGQALIKLTVRHGTSGDRRDRFPHFPAINFQSAAPPRFPRLRAILEATIGPEKIIRAGFHRIEDARCERDCGGNGRADSFPRST